MKILVDENVPRVTVISLRERDCDVLDVRGSDAEGSDDASLWRRAQSEQRLLITTDKGFVSFRNEAHFGILIVRLRQPNRQKIHERVLFALDRFTAGEWRGLIVVLRDTTMSVSRKMT